MVSFSAVNTKRYGGGATVNYNFARDWNLSLSGGDSEETLDSEVDRLNKVTGVRAHINSNVGKEATWYTQALLNGSLFNLPGGAAKASLGAEYRHEFYRFGPKTNPSRRQVSRHIKSIFGELFLPMLRHVDVSVGLRHDDYSDFGSTTNPKVGVSWRISPEFKLRSAYGTSFRAPGANLESAVGAGVTNIFADFVNNPTGPGLVPMVAIVGSRALKPEKAKTFSLGVDYTPDSVPGLRASLNYYNINYRDRIVTPPWPFDTLTNPNLAALITHYPTSAQMIAALSALVEPDTVISDFVAGVNFDLNSPGFQGSFDVLDDRQMNASVVKTSGLDFLLDYHRPLGDGDLRVALNASYIFGLKTQFTSTAPIAELVDTYANPVDLRGRLSAGWGTKDFDVAAAVNYTDGYTNNGTVLVPEPVRTFTTVDLNLRYTLGTFDFGASALNIFDRHPPHINNALGLAARSSYDSANASVLGRTLTFRISKKWW
jgi:outer membrane receptor protein involved in Fe transport